MNKIGRNERCPCGSGKKYKHCHLKSGIYEDKPTAAPDVAPTSVLDGLDIRYDSAMLACLIGALQLYMPNHERNVRLEYLLGKVLATRDTGLRKPKPVYPAFKEAVEAFEDHAYMEDTLTGTFSDNVVYSEGNAIVFPGQYGDLTVLLNQLMEAIFTMEHTLPEEFVSEVRTASHLLLALSNFAAENLKIGRNLFEENDRDHILVPDDHLLLKMENAIRTKSRVLAAYCGKVGMDYEILNDFIINEHQPDLQDEEVAARLLATKPLLVDGDDIVLVNPGGVVPAVTDFIFRQAHNRHCATELARVMNIRQQDLVKRALRHTGWSSMAVPLPAEGTLAHTHEQLFAFDRNKLAYVCFVQDHVPQSVEGNWAPVAGWRQPSPSAHVARASQVITYLSGQPVVSNKEVFCLFVRGEIAPGGIWAIPVATESYSLGLALSELEAIAYSKGTNMLTLYKFAKCYMHTRSTVGMFLTGGVLDAFEIYLQNKGSLLPVNDEHPHGGVMAFAPGISGNYNRTVHMQIDAHAVPIHYGTSLAFAKVIRYRSYAPIYVDREHPERLSIVIEDFPIPVWIIDTSKTEFGEHVAEAIAFWMHKMRKPLQSLLNARALMSVEINVATDPALAQRRYVHETVDTSQILIDCQQMQHGIQLTIPFAYLHLVKEADNRADRLLMNSVLTGLHTYMQAHGQAEKIIAANIGALVDDTLRPDHAKMLLLLDPMDNPCFDTVDLPPIQYLSNPDISWVLANLVHYLPVGVTVPNKVETLAEKKELVDQIVDGLAIMLTHYINEYDGIALLEWLIKLNERCIRNKEFKEIQVPAKIACFSDYETEIDRILDEETNLTTTAHAVRTLIEFVSILQPQDTKQPNLDDVDLLLAFTNQLTEWGATNEAMYMGIYEPEIGLLPSGRIGTSKDFEAECLRPYAVAKTEAELFGYTEDFAFNYAPSTNQRSETYITQEHLVGLDLAFEQELGVAFSRLNLMVDILAYHGFEQQKSCIAITGTQVREILAKAHIPVPFAENEIIAMLKLLTSVPRPALMQPPPGDAYSLQDVFTWRYNRQLGYLRRPLVTVQSGGEVVYLYGFRHLVAAMRNMEFLLFTGKYPQFVKKGALEIWLGTIQHAKGKPFRDQVVAWFKERPGLRVIEHEITPKHLGAQKSFGDIDVLVIDDVQKIVYPIECKNITGAKNILEMKKELDDYLGRKPNDKDALVNKHVRRNEWLVANPMAFKHFVENPAQYKIRSLVLTADEMALTYLKGRTIPMEIKSFALLRKYGIGYLKGTTK
ncbi:YecA family protein [Chitinophaga ginsengisoli]|uniref:SEC-C motif-containing protein n=1 Tax=Chitinophaga ginsengisoli TaxID=363837 RepID=A0A2P8FQS7_9BACT|nr:SEC-C domain-containing protein [Chitinophaga ginsengisoli]PSL24074.1 SEC-C motif-containing protein [Chitinophaga ginsengisoli]